MSTLESCLAVFQKSKHRTTIWILSSTPRYINKRIKYLWSHRNMYKVIHSLIIHNSLVVEEITCMVINQWTYKQNSIYIQWNIIQVEKGNINICYSMDDPWKPYAKWNSQATYCMIPFIWNARNKYIGRKSRLVVARDWQEKGGDNNS